MSASTAQSVSVFSFSPADVAAAVAAVAAGDDVTANNDEPPSTSTKVAVAAEKSTMAESLQMGSKAIVKNELSKQSSVCSDMNIFEEDVTRVVDS